MVTKRFHPMWALLRLGDVIRAPVGWGVQAGRTNQAQSIHLVAFSPLWLRAELWEGQEQTSGYLQSSRSLHSLRAIPQKLLNARDFHIPCVCSLPLHLSPPPSGPHCHLCFLRGGSSDGWPLAVQAEVQPPGGLCLHFVPFGGGGRMASRVGSW